MGWSEKYKKSIDCNNPKGFSQKAHCAGRKKKNENMVFEEITEDILNEKLITYGNRKPYGQVVFMAGGAGSGKGFAISNFVDSASFKIRDVDEMKKQLQILNRLGKLDIRSILKKYGRNIKLKDLDLIRKIEKDGYRLQNFNLKNPDHVYALHILVKAMGIKDNTLEKLLLGKQNPDTLPNILFDITAKDVTDITNVIPKLKEAGYKPENIHLTWVLTNYVTAMVNNKNRARMVPEDILLKTHEGAANTIWGLVTKALPKGMNGRVDVILNNPEHTVFYTDADGKTISGGVKGFLSLPLKKEKGGIFPEKVWKDKLFRWVKGNAPESITANMKESVNEANAQLNKKVKSYLDDYLRGEKKNSPEHQEAIMLIMRGALTDANFHSEARQLSKYFPKAKGKFIGTPMEDVIEDKGIQIAKWAKWDGYDIIDAFAFYTSMSIGGSFGAKFQSLKESLKESINEARRSVVHKAVKKGSFPVSLVVVKNGKVIDQELVNTPEAVPAAFNVIQSKHKGAIVHIEDKTGKRLFSESMDEKMDLNDPMLVRLRAAQIKRNQQAADRLKKAKSDKEKEKAEKLAKRNATKIKALKKKRAEVMRDMEQEAEMEGGPIADRYGKLLNRIDNDIIKLGGNPMTESINEWKLQLDLGKVNPSEFENWASDSLQKKHKIKVSGSGRNWTIAGRGNDDRMGSSADWISQLLGKAWKVNKIKVIQKESINEYLSPSDVDSAMKEFGIKKIPISSQGERILKGMQKEGFINKVTNKERLIYFYESLGKEKFGYGVKGKPLSPLVDRYSNDITSEAIFFGGKMAAWNVVTNIKDRLANREEVDSTYYMLKDYFNSFGIDTNRSRVFKSAMFHINEWLKRNKKIASQIGESLEERINLFVEENVPTKPDKWAYAISQAKKKFDVYPSAYANAWASKKYKELGGGWRKKKD